MRAEATSTEATTVPSPATTSMVKSQDASGCAQFHSQLPLLNDAASETELLNYCLPAVLTTDLLGIVSEQSLVERPKKRGRLQNWSSPSINRKAKTNASIRKRGLPEMTPDSGDSNVEYLTKKVIIEHRFVHSDDDKEDACLKLAMEANMMVLTNPFFDDEEMKAEAKRTIKLLLAKITCKALGPITPVALDYDI